MKGIDKSLPQTKTISQARTPVKRKRFVKMYHAASEVNRDLGSQHHEWMAIKSHASSRVDADPMENISYCPRLFRLERSFRMAKSHLRAWPVFHTLKAQIDTHRTVVVAVRAVDR